MTSRAAWPRLQVGLVLLFLVVTGACAIRLSGGAEPVALWWPGAGLGAVALTLSRRETWRVVAPAVALACLLANVLGGRPWGISACFAVVDAVEVVLVVWALGVVERNPRLVRLQDVVRLFAATAFGTVLGALGVGLVAAWLQRAEFLDVAAHTLASHEASILLILPLVLLPERLRLGRRSALELAAQIALLVAMTALVFGPTSNVILDVLPIPLFLWVSLRFGAPVVVLETLVFGLAVAGLGHYGHGPFTIPTTEPGGLISSSLFTEVYLICIGALGLTLTVVERERQATLTRVRASEAVFRTNFAASPVPMVLLRVAGDDPVVVNANGAASLVLEGDGPAAASYVGRPVAELLRTDPPLATIADDLLTGRLDGWSGPVEVLARPDASIVMSAAANATDEAHDLVSAQFVDLTDAHEARQRLIAEKLFSEAVIDISASLVVVTDLDGTVLSVNPAFTRSTGFTAGDVVGRKVWERLREPEFHDRAVERFASADETSVPADIELDVMTKDGGRRRMVLSNALARDPAGKPSRIVVTAIDVTAERESAGLVAHVLSSATTTAFVGTDLEGRITLFNTGAERLLRMDAAAARTRTVCDLLDPDDLVRHAAHTALMPGFGSLVAAVRGRHGPETRDWRLRDAAKDVRVSMTTNEVSDSFGQGIGFLFVMSDVTETRRSQEILVQALDREREAVRRLRMLDTAKEDFVSTVSHELRTPMTSIIGFVEMLEDGHVGELSAAQHGVVEKISRNGERLITLADDLLTLAAFESDGATPGTDQVDLGVVARQFGGVGHGALTHGDVDVSVEVPEEPVVVTGDAGHLERALANLVGNAVKFTPDGGQVKVRVTRDGDCSAVVEVRDTGIGIPADEVDAVFDKFFRSSNVHHHAIQGTGLGLAIVASIVQSHNGAISVDSTEGLGTTFTMRLPLG